MTFTTPIKVLSVLWVALILLAVLPVSPMINNLSLGLVGILLVAHLLEFIFLQKKISKKPQGNGQKFMYTMFFGLFYILQRA